MKNQTYIATIKERIGDYEHTSTILLDDTSDETLHRIAREERSSNPDDWDEDMNAYWFGDGVVFLPEVIRPISDDEKEIFLAAQQLTYPGAYQVNETMKLSDYYTMDIKWTDTGDEASGLIVCEYDCGSDDAPVKDDDVFFYGLSRDAAVADIGKPLSGNDYIITAVHGYMET